MNFYDVETDSNNPYLQAVCKWWLSQKPSYFLILCGSVGIGKTYASWWLSQNANKNKHPRHTHWESGSSPIFLTCSELLATPVWDFSNYYETDLLVLDDYKTLSDKLDTILSQRHSLCYRRKQPKLTIITTNLNPSDFVKTLDTRLVDRIQSNAEFVEESGPSLRKNGKS